MTTGLVVLVVAVAAAVGVGLWRARADGRIRGTHRVWGAQTTPEGQNPEGQNAPEELPPSVLTGTPYDGQLGERATLLQFSSAFCAPCRATRRVLADVAVRTPGVAHVEVDAERHLGLVRRMGVLRTPTTVVLDRHGHEVGRATGAPRPRQVEAVLELLGCAW